MDYLKGYNIKPYEIQEPTNFVLFTDGKTNDIVPNQAACEAYGYYYDTATGTCRLKGLNSGSVNAALSNASNTVRNGSCVNSNNMLLAGVDNQCIRSNNGFITGKENIIESSRNNAAVFGVNGNVNRQNEFAIGGGQNAVADDPTLGSPTYLYTNRKMSIVELSGVSTDNSNITLTVGGDGSSLIDVKPSSIIGYEIYITRLELAGTAATVGDFSYRNRKGVVQIDSSYNMNFIVGFTRNIGKVGGVNGTFTEIDTSSGVNKSWSIQCSDRNNVTNIWSAVVYLHEIVSTNVDIP
tara:strand:+ start:6878 stop:7762 length:885 start_codon:yes stop_codon:yes gene_type:complete